MTKSEVPEMQAEYIADHPLMYRISWGSFTSGQWFGVGLGLVPAFVFAPTVFRWLVLVAIFATTVVSWWKHVNAMEARDLAAAHAFAEHLRSSLKTEGE